MPNCLYCGEPFDKVKDHQIYCKRSCFRKAYRDNKNIKEFPFFKCSNCGKLVKLTFHVKEDYDRWEDLQCTFCGVYNQDTINPFELLEDKLENNEI